MRVRLGSFLPTLLPSLVPFCKFSDVFFDILCTRYDSIFVQRKLVEISFFFLIIEARDGELKKEIALKEDDYDQLCLVG